MDNGLSGVAICLFICLRRVLFLVARPILVTMQRATLLCRNPAKTIREKNLENSKLRSRNERRRWVWNDFSYPMHVPWYHVSQIWHIMKIQTRGANIWFCDASTIIFAKNHTRTGAGIRHSENSESVSHHLEFMFYASAEKYLSNAKHAIVFVVAPWN